MAIEEQAQLAKQYRDKGIDIEIIADFDKDNKTRIYNYNIVFKDFNYRNMGKSMEIVHSKNESYEECLGEALEQASKYI